MTASSSLPRTTLVATLLALTACTGEISGPGTGATNIPVVGMNPGQFGFAITARDWSSDQTYDPNMSSTSVQVGLAIAGYSGGSGQLAVTDATGASVYTASLAGNIAAGSNATAQGTPPFHIRITASHYTGIVSLGISSGAAQ